MQQVSDDGYIIIGFTRSFGAGNNDVYLIRADSNGDPVWTRSYGGSDNDRGWAIQQTSNGDYVIAGYTHSYGAGGSDVYMIKTNETTDVSDHIISQNPNQFKLHNNYPNPFNSSTTIKYDIVQSNKVILSIYDLLGNEVTRLVDTNKHVGTHSVIWDSKDSFGNEVSSGIYFAFLNAGDFTKVNRILLMK